jgi:molybdenum cofactor guanylyltransferase
VHHQLVQGYVLAGGRSSRFGGDKALAIAGGRTLLSRALGALRGVGLEPTIVSPRAETYARYRAGRLTRERPDQGPVEGVRVALEECAFPWALILSVDMPGVMPVCLDALLARAASALTDARAFCFRDAGGRRHPFPGLYDRRLADALRGWPRRPGGVRSMQDLLDLARVRSFTQEELPQPVDLKRVLRNVNRPADL